MHRALILVAVFFAGVAVAEEPPSPDERNRSYGIPAAEILGFQFLLNRFDRRVYGEDYAVSIDSVRRNLEGGWVIDNDPYKINQLLHPYQGSIYHGFARSAGLGFWTSLGYTFAGSLTWEIAGETTPPSKNDQVASGIAGSFLGESLFRMSSLVLEKGDGSRWRELAAALVSPSTGFNRLAFGERFRDVWDSRDAAYYSRVQLGASGALHQAATPPQLKRNELLLDYSMEYGLPGKDGYRYERPWDYFAFQATASSANAVENLSTHGLLIGTDYAVGKRYRGLWGLYGSYDYFSPQVFRISSTALSLGTTAQFRVTPAVTLQGTVLGGVGYAGVSTLHGSSDTDYHYGVTPQGLFSLRAIFGNRAALGFSAREFFVSRVAGAGTGGHDNIARADLTLTLRVYREHGVAIKYLWSRRDATFPTLDDLSQSRATVGLYYSYLARGSMGAVP